MKILIFGATGRIGKSIVNEAISRGHEVTAAVRSLGKGSILNPQIRVVSAQVDDAASVERAARGQDAVVSAVGGLGHENPRIVIDSIAPLVQGMMKSEVLRLLVVGTAGTLEVASGGLRKDQSDFPERLREEAESHAETLQFLRQLSPELVRWTYFSPPARIEPGQRGPLISVGQDKLLFNEDGTSFISYEDYAAAAIDELEHPRHIGRRFTAISGESVNVETGETES